MKYLLAIILISNAFLFSSCNCENSNKNSTKDTIGIIEDNESALLALDKIDDGFYLVLNTWEDSSLIEPAGGKIISFNHDFLEDNKKGQPFFIEVQTSEFVPLSLSKKPEGVEQEDKRIKLILSMTDSASVKLKQFTEKHVNKKTCIVVGGKAVTMHKIREAITGGKLQITRCTDNACKHLLLELEDNVKK